MRLETFFPEHANICYDTHRANKQPVGDTQSTEAKTGGNRSPLGVDCKQFDEIYFVH